jgi:hypothetical protein
MDVQELSINPISHRRPAPSHGTRRPDIGILTALQHLSIPVDLPRGTETLRIGIV